MVTPALQALGNVVSGSDALAQAAVHDGFSAGLVAAKMAWEGGRPHEAILRLQQQRRALASLDGVGGGGGGAAELHLI
mgnify:CR=1 FL=1